MADAHEHGEQLAVPHGRKGATSPTLRAFIYDTYLPWFEARSGTSAPRAPSAWCSRAAVPTSRSACRIKEQGGITLAQVPEDAEFDGMPRAALETGMVDLALPDGDTAEAEAPAGLL